MENQFKKSSGFSLIAGSFLLVVTMVLHPSGGSMEHILAIYDVIVASHALAIFSMPFVAFGFYGLAVSLETPGKLSLLAFMVVSFGLIAAMFAGTINGLTLPLFLSGYSDEIEQNRAVLTAVLRYGFAINKPLDYIFIAAGSLAVGLWSALIIRHSRYPRWVGYYGLSLLMIGLLGAILRFNFINLFGFRIFIFGLVSWIVMVGILMIRKEAGTGEALPERS